MQSAVHRQEGYQIEMINWKDCSYSDNRPLISSQTFSSSSFANAKFSCISVLYLSQFDFFFKTFEDATSNSPFSVFSDQTINLLIKKIIIRFDVQWKSSVFKGFCADFSFKKNTHTHTKQQQKSLWRIYLFCSWSLQCTHATQVPFIIPSCFSSSSNRMLLLL